MTVVCSLGEKAETQQGFQEFKQVCADPRSIVKGTSKARRPLKLQQTPAEGRDQRPPTHPNLSMVAFHAARGHSNLCSLVIWWHVTEKVILFTKTELGLVILA